MTTTAAARKSLLKIAEGLWTALIEMNRDDVHGVRSLAWQRDDMPYGQTWNALRGVVRHMVDGNLARADRVMHLLADNLESVAFNLDVEAEEHATAIREAVEGLELVGAAWRGLTLDEAAPVEHACKHCGATIAFEPRYGWVDQLSGDDGGTYDACQGDYSDGTHVPDCNGPCEDLTV